MKHDVYSKISEQIVLNDFINEHKLTDDTLDFIDSKIISKNTEFDLCLFRTEKDSLLLTFEKESKLEKVYQLTKDGKTFRVNVPSSILNYINNLRTSK